MFKIGGIKIGINKLPYFIADIAANHDGDINRAYKLIELAKEAGAHAAKFQNFKADSIVNKNEFDNMPKSTHQSSWNKSVYQVYKDASIPDEWTKLLKQKCDECGIEYMTSPYDFKSVDLVNPYLNAFKIGSGDITWIDIVEYIAQKRKPVLLATGASSIDDVKRAVSAIMKYTDEIVLMQCNTNYTADINNYKYINLNVLSEYKELFPNVILGLSDHTHGHTTVLGALTLGARVFEKHFTDDNSRTGPDHKFAMNPTTWKHMVDETNNLFFALGDGIKKVETNEKETYFVQRRSLYATKEITKGSIINTEDVIALRPEKNNGFLPYQIADIVGKVAKNNISELGLIEKGDI